MSALVEHIIEPAKAEVAQLRNGLVPRRGPKRCTISNWKAIQHAEEKLLSGNYSPMQFLKRMSHLYSKLQLTQEEREQYAEHLEYIAELEH